MLSRNDSWVLIYWHDCCADRNKIILAIPKGLDANGDFVKKNDIERVQQRVDLLVTLAETR